MSATENSLSDNERQLLAREIAADKRQTQMQRDYSTSCPDCDSIVWVYSASQDERKIFLEGWNAAIEYVKQQRVDDCIAIEVEMS